MSHLPETTTTDTRATRLSKSPSVPRTLTRTTSPTGSAGTPVAVPNPASHKACRLLNLNDLPAGAQPTEPPRYETFSNDPDQCRIEDSLYEINPGATENIVWFRVTVIVSQDLSPIDRFVGADAESAGHLITLGDQRAVERVWSNEPRCAVYLEPAPEPFAVVIRNSRYPQYAPCDLARSLAEAILRRYR